MYTVWLPVAAPRNFSLGAGAYNTGCSSPALFKQELPSFHLFFLPILNSTMGRRPNRFLIFGALCHWVWTMLQASIFGRKSYFQWRVHWNVVHWSLFSVNGFTENTEAIFYFQWRVHWNYGHWNLFSVNDSLKYWGIGIYFQWIASLRIKLK